MGEILIGTSSWADKLLLASGWYPPGVNTAAARLAYYGRRYQVVEVDTTYYAIPAVEVTESWVAHSPESFVFDIKAFSIFSGHTTKAANLPQDLRPAGAHSEEQLRRRDLSVGAYDELWSRFKESLEPLAVKGKLGVILLQFPHWFKHGEREQRRIIDSALRCQPFRAAVELRHSSWFTAQTAERTLAMLAEHDITYCCVDMPQGHETSVPPILIATADTAMVRFHGHSKLWATGNKQEQFRYAYGDDELAAWAVRLRELSHEADRLHVLMNNCCAGQAQTDAAKLAELLGLPWSHEVCGGSAG
ncbi:hypothetical protein Rhe02_51980 [Rhizocola hellebori]|uniref:DUF72 domain-containing protein n=1 Tax=Rhizocola hellebori TaxID=1392758 RepID=A0A8J3QCY9_9ACTN|nr:DUF72 domain-containing protein [Rhizocola hellebori]GIH07131.1 hypothetical protein Rhe02_51980 [Rhizocola hellebori]